MSLFPFSELLLTSSYQPSSYVPSLINEFSPQMNFVERFVNSFYKLGLWADAKFNSISTDWIGKYVLQFCKKTHTKFPAIMSVCNYLSLSLHQSGSMSQTFRAPRRFFKRLAASSSIHTRNSAFRVFCPTHSSMLVECTYQDFKV